MTSKETSATEAERCGDRAEHFRVSCDRAKGHVRSASPDDWHEASSSLEQHQRSQTWTFTSSQTEAVRWAPHPWDLPRGDDD